MDDKLKSSAFWLAFKDYEGRTVTSDRRYWGLDFQIDKEANSGRTDFKVNIRQVMPPSVALRDYFRKNIWIELWEERPRLSEKPVEGTDEIALEAVLSADNIPETEKRMRGVVRVQTDQWIFGKEILADA